MISEVDLKDWEPTEQPVKLYNVGRESVISIPGIDAVFQFHNIDGMYSSNTILTGEHRGELTHIAAWTEVFKWHPRAENT